MLPCENKLISILFKLLTTESLSESMDSPPLYTAYLVPIAEITVLGNKTKQNSVFYLQLQLSQHGQAFCTDYMQEGKRASI